MNSASKLCGLILAAGESSRMGTDKALLPWPPSSSGISSTQTLLSAAISAFKPLTSCILVVAGKNCARIAPIVDANGALLVHNPSPERGQFSSLQLGLRELLADGCDAAIITPVDCPPLTESSLVLLRASFEKALARGLWAVAPENGGKHGHPLLVSREFIDAFLVALVTSNAREVLHAYADRIEHISVPDELVKAGFNTPQDYAAHTGETPQGC